MSRMLPCLLAFVLGSLTALPDRDLNSEQDSRPKSPRLGNFSVSLAVKDLAASQAFYEKLGFRSIMGKAQQNWVILQNDGATIGLFQGFFEKNILTFNPGWDRAAKTLDDFDDVRELQAAFEKQGITLSTKADADSKGPASFTLTDPDGNMILVDQHVPMPKR